MAFNTYNNNQNDKKPSVQTFTPITFSNSESSISQSRFSISYFNNLMKIEITPRVNSGSNDQFAKYENPITVYVSYAKAKILHDAIVDMLEDNSKHNVCVELKNGLFKVSDGVEFGSQTPCFTITYAMKDGAESHEIIYQTKSDQYYAAYNFRDNSYDTIQYPRFELNTLIMVLEQYYLASSYAVAATVKESNMYMNNGRKNLLHAMAEKVGVDMKQFGGGNSSGNQYSNRSFLSNNGSNGGSSSYNGQMSGTAKEYQRSSFDDIVNSMDE